MHPGVHHQPASAPHLVGEPAEVAVRVFVEAHLEAETLGVETPALAVGADSEVASELGQVEFLGERDLQVMAGHRLVQGERFQGVERAILQAVGVHPVAARLVGIERGPHIAAAGVFRRDGVGNRLDRVGLAGQPAEETRQRPVHPLGDPGRLPEQLFGCVHIEARIRAQELEERGEASAEPGGAHRLLHLAPNALHFGKADPVDLLGGPVEGGEASR